jgi:Cd2+/Zn2+-exporting ATPase
MLETKTVSLPVTLPKGFEECERCVGRLRDSLLQVDGVTSVNVNAHDSTMTLVYDPHLVPLEDVEKRATSIGVDLREHYEHKTLTLDGLDCPDCALKLEKGVGRLSGVLWVSTNFASSKISVEYEPEKVGLSAISQRVHDFGYDIKEMESERRGHGVSGVTGRWMPRRQTFLTIAAGISILFGLLFSFLHMPIAAKVAYGASALFGGIYAARGAVFAARSLAFDMNFLMTVAAVGAIAIGDWFEAAAVMFLFSLGNALEARTMESARESVRSLVNLFPQHAHVRRGEAEIEIPAAEVHVGDVFVVRPGEKVPTDGEVVAGSSTVNQSSVTGESVPVEKGIGDTIFAGTINERGSLDARATATATDNTLAKIIHLVEEAQSEKAPSQRFTEIFGLYYSPCVIGLAVLVAAVGPVAFGFGFRYWLYKALTLLVVSCPCALVISTPVTIVSAIANAARNGILFKGGTHLEAAGGIEVVAFDKTGTITTGESQVTDIIPKEGFTADEVLSIAASVESRSEHPLAAAILRKAKESGVAIREVTDFEALTGMGAAAKFDGETAVVGNSRLIDQLGLGLDENAQELGDLQAEGKTAVLVVSSGRLAGMIALQDTVRESAKEAFEELRRIGIQRIVMITGDNEAAARSVARDLEIDEYYAELLPQDKVDIVRVLIERFGSRVAVVGDGVNDAPALAAATLGIAMGAAGSDTALETADIALMSDDLRRLPYAIRLGRKTLGTIRQNIAFALLVIVGLVSTALFGWLKLSLGVFGHEGSALIVIANGIRMRRFK